MTPKFVLTWTAPTSGTATDYLIQYSTDGISWNTYIDDISNNTSGTVTGLNTCEYYQFRVAAINLAGTGSYSATATGIMGNMPFAPINISGTPEETSISLYWTMPNNGGCAITGHYIEYSGNGSIATGISTSGDTQHTLTGLTGDTEYVVRVAAVNVVDVGPYSTGVSFTTSNITVAGSPSNLQVEYIEVLEAPSGLSAVSPNSGEILLSWVAPDTTNKIGIDYYNAQYSGNGSDWAPYNWSQSSDNSGTITGLTNNTNYAFKVAAVNLSGTVGDYSSVTSGVPGLPSAPILLSGVYNEEGNINVFFTPSEYSGGYSITGYNFYDFYDIFEPVAVISLDLINNTGVISYTMYGSLSMAAVNSIGEGPKSNTINVPY